jgi:hypothetical protein
VAEVTRARLEAVTAEVLDTHAGECRVDHRVIATKLADALGLEGRPPIAIGIAPRPATELDLGVWLDDPPRITLDGRYLDRLLELPLSHVAVMIDGPAPGLSDAKWDWRALELLAKRLPPRVTKIATVWLAPQREAVDELAARLPRLLEALGAAGVEGDVEPAGAWRPADVKAYADKNADGSRLDDAAAHLADVLVAQRVSLLETTTVPGALRAVAPLIRALAAAAKPSQTVRYLSQDYAVRHRSSGDVEWDGPLGPLRIARDGRTKAETLLPKGVAIGSGAAAYDTTWPDGRDSMLPAIETARASGTRLVRLWSAKWLARLAKHEGRRAKLKALR